jgi:CubicO group peptidase (beta-lactamase class C family)
LATRLAREPGVAFEYNNATTELIGAILQKATGKTVDVLAREDIFTPLGIESVDWKPRLGNGYPMANSGLGLRPRDRAKIGQLVLNGGVWQGKQIVSTSWIRQSTRAHISAPDQYTYGFHWWLGHSLSNDRVIAWTAALGSRAQKTIIVPELDLVVVFNASIRSANMIAPEIELLNQYILPAILQR